MELEDLMAALQHANIKCELKGHRNLIRVPLMLGGWLEITQQGAMGFFAMITDEDGNERPYNQQALTGEDMVRSISQCLDYIPWPN